MELWAAAVLIVADLLYGGVLLAWLGPSHDAAGTEQLSEGPCKPPVVDISGTIAIECRGVEGKAQEYLNARLSDILRRQLLAGNAAGRPIRTLDERLDDLRRQADDWAGRYRELWDRLPDSGPTRQARGLIRQGEIDAAEAALQAEAAGQDPGSEAAATQYMLGDAAMLRFDPAAAVLHFEKACRTELENPLYASGYAMAAYRARYLGTAERGWMAALELYRDLAEADAAAYRPDVAATLSNLGILYGEMGRLADARKATAEALAITRALAAEDPKSYAGRLAVLTRRLAALEAAVPAPKP